MKRTLSLITALVLALILAIPAYADGTVTVTIPEADMTLSVPEDLVIFTREHMAEEDLAAYNLTREHMDDLFDSRSIYLNAWNANMDFELLVTVADNAVQDFSAFTDAQLMEMGDLIIDAYENTGIQCSNVQIYKAGSLRFLKMEGSGNDFIIFDNSDGTITCPESLTITCCDRHHGVGGDGVVLIERSQTADARMRMFNQDGSEGSIAGNAIRCVGK